MHILCLNLILEKCEAKKFHLYYNDDLPEYTSLPVTTGQFQLHQELHVVPEHSEAAASWENLQEVSLRKEGRKCFI